MGDECEVTRRPDLGERLLRWVERKRLQAPAALVVELHRPLAPLAWSAAMLFGGILAPLFGPDYYERIESLRDPALFDRILRRLEADAASRD
jgi:hypothetical protein